MSARIYRYEFAPDVPPDEVEASILIALIGAESIHGETMTRLSASHYFDRDKRVCIVEADGVVGRDFNSMFAGFLRREFGPSQFRVRRAEPAHVSLAAA